MQDLPSPARAEGPWDPDALLEHAGWMHRLARHLMGSSDRAEDLVQESLTVAIGRPPRHRANLRGWLYQMLVRRAKDTARSDGRRRRRELSSSEPPLLPSAEALAMEAELHRRVVHAVLALKEPYRSTVLLRYFHGYEAANIAQAGSVPAATVRTRLKRGLEQLRGALDADYRDETYHWSSLVLPVAVIPRRAAWVTPWAGGFVVACLAVVALTASSPNPSSAGPAAIPMEPPFLTQASHPEMLGQAVEELPSPNAREVVGRSALSSLPVAKSSPTALAPATSSETLNTARAAATIRCRIVDRVTGLPLPGVMVKRPDVGWAAATDAFGEFLMQVSLGEQVGLLLDKEKHVPAKWSATIADLDSTQIVVLPMDELSWVVGTVRDLHGATVAGCQVGAFHEDQGFAPPERSDGAAFTYPGWMTHEVPWKDASYTTDLEGRFEIPVRPSETRFFTLEARADVDGKAVVSPLWVREGGVRVQAPLNYELKAPTGVIVGRLTYNGTPLRGRLIEASGRDGFRALRRTRSEGRYRFANVPPDRITLRLLQRAGEQLPAPVVVESSAGQEVDSHIDWVESLVPIRGRVLLANGAPATGVRVDGARGKTNETRERFQTRTDAEGHFEIMVRPGGPLDLSVFEHGFSTRFHGPVAPGTDDVSLQLAHRRWVGVRLLDAVTSAVISDAVDVGMSDVGWRTSDNAAFTEARPEELMRFDGSLLMEVRADDPEATVTLRVHLAGAGFRVAEIAGLTLAASPEEASPIDMPLQRGILVRLAFEGDEPLTHAIKENRLWFLLEESQRDEVRGQFPDQGGASNARIGRINVWMQTPTLMNQMPTIDGSSHSLVQGLTPGRYTLRSFPGDIVFDPEWFDIRAEGQEIRLRWSRR